MRWQGTYGNYAGAALMVGLDDEKKPQSLDGGRALGPQPSALGPQSSALRPTRGRPDGRATRHKMSPSPQAGPGRGRRRPPGGRGCHRAPGESREVREQRVKSGESRERRGAALRCRPGAAEARLPVADAGRRRRAVTAMSRSSPRAAAGHG